MIFECAKCKKRIDVYRVRRIKNKDIDLSTGKCLKCDICGDSLQFVMKEGIITAPALGKFASMTDAEKKQVIRKRHLEHMKKKGKEENISFFRNKVKRLNND